jgi:hypothetical protein
VQVPAEIADVLHDSGNLEERIVRDLDLAGRYRAGIRGQQKGMAVICGTIVLISCWGFGPGVRAGLQGNWLHNALFGLSALLVAAFIFGPLGAWVMAHRLATHRHLSRLPFALLTLSDRVVPSCPSCGSELKASSALTATCSACDTESLLPAPLVSARLQRKHARAVAAHDELRVARGQGMSVVAEAQRAMGTTYLALGWLYLFAIPVLTAIFKLSGMLKQSWAEVAVVSVLTVVQAAGVCFLVGYLTRRAASKLD